MDKSSLYIQKLIAFFLVFLAGAYLSKFISTYYLIPGLFFTLAFLVSRITGEKPGFLFGLEKSDDFLNKKAGFWLLFKWILILFGFVYDIVAWTIFGVYILFTVVLDFILLIKTVLFWLIHAVLWFLKQFVPPLVFVYKMLIYYLFRWTWWIYKISFNNIRKSIHANSYFISLWGAVLMLFVVLLFYGAGMLIGIPEIAIVGAVFSILPLVWSYGEISSLRLRNADLETYPQAKVYFRSGFDAVRAILNYFIVFLVLALVEVAFNLLGWIPQVGFSFMGLALNINTLASLILLFVFVILLFAKLIMPPHVVYNNNFRPDFDGSINFLGVIGRRFLRYVVSFVPTGIFGAVVIAIPAVIVFLAVVISLNVKNSIIDSRVDILNHRISVMEGLEKYQTRKDLERLYFYKAYPNNINSGFAGLKSLSNDVKNLKENIMQGEDEVGNLTVEFSSGIDTMNSRIEAISSKPLVDSISRSELVGLEQVKKLRLETFSKWKEDADLTIAKMKIDLADKKGLMLQLPLVFLLTVIWVSFFGGLVLAFLISYLGNVYFELYNFKEDNKAVYFLQVASELNDRDRNQPLLGFTLIALLALAAAYFFKVSGALQTWMF